MMLRRVIYNSNYPYNDAHLAFLAKIVTNDFLTGSEGGLAPCFDEFIGQTGSSLLADFCLCIEESDMNPNYLTAELAMFELAEKEAMLSAAFNMLVGTGNHQQALLLRAIARLIKRSVNRAAIGSFFKNDLKDLVADISEVEKIATGETAAVRKVRFARMHFILMVACLLGDDCMIKALLASEGYKSVVNLRINDQGLTMLAYAILDGNESVVVDLLRAGAYLLQSDISEMMIRADQERPKIALLIDFCQVACSLKNGKPFYNSIAIEELTSKIFTIKKYQLGAVLVALMPLDQFQFVLNFAAKSVDPDVISIIIASKKVATSINCLNTMDENGFSPYSYVLGRAERLAHLGECEEAKKFANLAIIMKSKGASVVSAEKADQCADELQHPQFMTTIPGAPKSTLLLNACRSGATDAKFYVLGLIRQGACVNVSDETGKTPLVYAVLTRDEELALLILQNLTETLLSGGEIQLPSGDVFSNLCKDKNVAKFIKAFIQNHLASQAKSIESQLLLCHFYPDLVVPNVQVDISSSSSQHDLAVGIKIAEVFIEVVLLRNLHLYVPDFWPNESLKESSLMASVAKLVGVVSQLFNYSVVSARAFDEIALHCKGSIKEVEESLKFCKSVEAEELCRKLSGFLSLLSVEQELSSSLSQEASLARSSSAPCFGWDH
jgi:ankyrin repeat protein